MGTDTEGQATTTNGWILAGALCEVHQRPRQKNGVCPSCYFREWYEKNRDGVIARTRTWKKGNRAKHLVGKRRWQRRHGDVIRQAQRRHKARALDNEVVLYREWAIYERDAWTCHVCGLPIDPTAAPRSSGAPTLDHLIPTSVGGADAPWNVRPAHMGCNSRKGKWGPAQLLLPFEDVA